MSEVVSSPTYVDILRVAGATLLIAAIAWLVGRFAKTGLPRRPERRLELLERLTVGKGAQLTLVSVEGRRLLIGSGDKPVCLVLDLDPGMATFPLIHSDEPPAIEPVPARSTGGGFFETAVAAWMNRDSGRSDG